MPERFLPALIADVAAATPDAVAVRQHHRTLTFADLHRSSNALAALLLGDGIRAEDVVAIWGSRTPELPVAMTGVLAAGAAYLPLDPDHPPARLRSLIRDCGARLLIVSGDRPATVDVGVPVLDLSTGPRARQVAEGLATPPPVEISADRLAYVLHTSGSTGRPKGVMVTHGGLAAYLDWARRAYAVTEGSGAPLHSTVAADLSLTALLVPLAAGRAVHLLPPGPAVSELAEALRGDPDYSLVKLTPSHLALLGHELADQPPIGWRGHLVVGGEQLGYEQLAAWRRFAPASTVTNEYGPTETVVGCCAWQGTGTELSGNGVVPIGHPIDGAELFLLDETFRPVADGDVGELHVGGPGVARGYLGRPAATAERFLPHPTRPGARVYRTGDLARRRPDGALVYVGRVDDQVQLRGHRVEPGEVEVVLAGCAGVDACAVVVQGDGPVARLVAFVVGAATPENVVATLARLLPAHLVPSVVTVVDALPMTDNGKTDRRRLRARVVDRPAGRPMPAATGQLEERLATLWAEVLEIPTVGWTDRFQDLGGSSIHAGRLLARIRSEIGKQVTFRQFAALGTVVELAAHLRGEQGARPALPPIRPTERDLELPSSGQQRLWLLSQLSPAANVAYTVPTALRLRGAIDVPALAAALNDVVRRHDALRMALVLGEQRLTARVHPDVELPLPVVDLRASGEGGLGAAMRQATAMASLPMDLAVPPLARAALLRLAPEDHLLVVVFHHVVVDGTSVEVFDRELSAHYALRTGGGAPPPPVALRYRDYVCWEHDLRASGAIDTAVAHWGRTLADAPAVLELPSRASRPAVQTYRGRRVRRSVPSRTAEQAVALGRARNVTPYVVFLTAFGVLLRQLTGRDEMLVGSPAAGRPSREAETVIGCFANTLVLRLRLTADMSFDSAVRATRDVVHDALERQYVPFERLVRAAGARRDPSRPPLVQAAMAYHGSRRARARIGDTDVTPVFLDNGTAKFDLLLELDETPEGLVAGFEYNLDLFDQATVDDWLDDYLRIVDACLSAVETPISEQVVRS